MAAEEEVLLNLWVAYEEVVEVLQSLMVAMVVEEVDQQMLVARAEAVVLIPMESVVLLVLNLEAKVVAEERSRIGQESWEVVAAHKLKVILVAAEEVHDL